MPINVRPAHRSVEDCRLGALFFGENCGDRRSSGTVASPLIAASNGGIQRMVRSGSAAGKAGEKKLQTPSSSAAQ